MKMMYTHITIIACFLSDTWKWKVLRGKEKYLLNSLYKKLKKKVSLKQMETVKNLSLQQIKSNI